MIQPRFSVFGSLGLFSWVLLGAGIYLGHKWYQPRVSYDFNLQRSYFDPTFGYNQRCSLFIAARLLLCDPSKSRHPAGPTKTTLGTKYGNRGWDHYVTFS